MLQWRSGRKSRPFSVSVTCGSVVAMQTLGDALSGFVQWWGRLPQLEKELSELEGTGDEFALRSYELQIDRHQGCSST